MLVHKPRLRERRATESGHRFRRCGGTAISPGGHVPISGPSAPRQTSSADKPLLINAPYSKLLITRRPGYSREHRFSVWRQALHLRRRGGISVFFEEPQSPSKGHLSISVFTKRLINGRANTPI
ncbi:hypothetical protein EYF80_017344 [Liparis tanakae]|uniref:Uncharacterized protein n=1 Tax=Liparis tanakae TaxID=230148 RepID=A0A4Z2I3A6_9TELE|nr:hypothetical protein EYF80_017344 [Liparis tanakae]